MITYAPVFLLLTILSCIDRSHQSSCDENEFRCGSGQCIDNFLVCDGEKNCADGTDETKQVCSKTHAVCQPYAFRCAYGACIDGDKKCDGKADCADSSDEHHPDCKTPSTPPDSNSTCTAGTFRCDSGQCISDYAVCDGELNCRDGSDESEALCVNFACPEIGFQCSYGACIDKDMQCDGTKNCRDGSDEDSILCGGQPGSNPGGGTPHHPGGGSIPTSSTKNSCLLPRQPYGGVFLVANCPEDDVSDKCRRIPGTVVGEYTSLSYSCVEGFNISDTNNIRYCINGAWYPVTPVICLELCKGIKSSSVEIDCEYQGKKIQNCSEPVLPGTKASLRCMPSYKLQSISASSEIVCKDNGRWSESPFHCTPECGIRTHKNAVTPLVSYGENTSAVEYPWASGLYKYDNKIGYIDLFCGGTIITPYMILSVAHCMFENNRMIGASVVKVVVGKTIRSWEVKDVGEQRLNVEKIFVHPDYRGSDNNYAFDIAVLELTTNIIIGRVTMPICIEWIPPWSYIPNGTNGTVVGWGRTEHNKLSPNLLSVNLTYVDQETCKTRTSFKFRRFITHDKFCADYKNGAGVQQGDSGGGLVFLKPENGLYYIHGLVSTKPQDEDTFATFTNISIKTNMVFLRETRQNLMIKHEWVQNF